MVIKYFEVQVTKNIKYEGGNQSERKWKNLEKKGRVMKLS